MPKVKIIRNVHDLESIRPLWESLFVRGRYTVFQNFDWNRLALNVFSGREEPFVVCAEASYGAAIIPGVIRHGDASLRLAGEELFDYRSFLEQGEPEVLAWALSELSQARLPLRIVAVRDRDYTPSMAELPRQNFCGSPAVHREDLSSDEFAHMHGRLARNLRRLGRLGFSPRAYSGHDLRLLRSIYEAKARQDPESLFWDPLRIDFLINAASAQPHVFEIFVLEKETALAAALVVLRDRNVRRFYTGWFDPALEKYSPGMSLIYEITRRSLEMGLDCDYMTGDQPYKLRLATRGEPLYRIEATADELAEMGRVRERLPA